MEHIFEFVRVVCDNIGKPVICVALFALVIPLL